MAKLSKYNIAFKGLGQGIHEFDYQIDKKFFEYFDGGIANDGDVAVRVKLEKESSLMIIWFSVNGTVKIQCDRCLELYDQPVKSENKLFVKYGEETFDEGDDVIWISPADHQLNVAKLIYDFIILSIPIRQVHPDDRNGNSTCDPEMLERLNSLMVPDRTEGPADSRWDDLKKLLGNE
ncbi:MAG: DUF177 domain-containing protein [Prolixibacteraceae bacterium]